MLSITSNYLTNSEIEFHLKAQENPPVVSCKHGYAFAEFHNSIYENTHGTTEGQCTDTRQYLPVEWHLRENKKRTGQKNTHTAMDIK